MLLLSQADVRAVRGLQKSRLHRGLHAVRRRASPSTSALWTGSFAAGSSKFPTAFLSNRPRFIEPVNTCYKAVELLACSPDETVLVIGQGPIGVLLAALAKKTGATVLTSDPLPGTPRHRSKVWP